MRYEDKENIKEYILEMSHLVSKLNELKLEFSEDLLVHLILISLLAQFDRFKANYNGLRDKWSLSELTSHCIQEEEKLKQEVHESVHLDMILKNKTKKRNQGIEAAGEPPLKKQQKNQDKKLPCFFCKHDGHIKKDCAKYHTWRIKKGDFLILICFKDNLT